MPNSASASNATAGGVTQPIASAIANGAVKQNSDDEDLDVLRVRERDRRAQDALGAAERSR